MKVIISPAKTMRDNEDGFAVEQKPIFLKEAQLLLSRLKPMSSEELMTLMKCNQKIAELNYQRFQTMDLENSLTPALFSYDGLQYKSMAPHVFTSEEYAWVKAHLIILSGFYGMLHPADGVRFYRLEMQTELSIEDKKNLYEFWSDKVYQKLYEETDTVINLASKEYSQMIEPYLKATDRMITCVFGVLSQNKIKVKGTLAKMARGAMVRWMAENQVNTIEQLKQFNQQGFEYQQEYSTDQELVFIKEERGKL